MYEYVTQSTGILFSISWIEIVKIVPSVVTAVIAFLALKNWRRQDKAKREVEFLDSLVDATHAYISEMRSPVGLLEIAKIGIRSHVPSDAPKDVDDSMAQGAICYIQRRGNEDAQRLLDALKDVQPLAVRLRSLAAKGQVFRFPEYKKCQNAIAMLTWNSDRIEAFAVMIASSSINWGNPEVLRTLKSVISIDPNDVRATMQESNRVILDFSVVIYSRIYG